jgi:MtN3 and saliva related transmembrane protein
MNIEWIGWASSVILLATLLRQVYTQWKSRDLSGVSRWLFIGQVTASVGYTIYSLLLHNWVYATSNIAILITAVAGEAIYLRKKHAQHGGERR